MSSPNLIPDAEDLHQHFASTIEEVPARIGSIGTDLATNRDLIEYHCFEFQDQTSTDWELKLSPNWEFKIQDERDFSSSEGRAVVGADLEVVDGDYQRCSFNLSIIQRGHQITGEAGEGDVNRVLCCVEDREDTWTMVRRFHFDMDPGRPGEEAKPVCHLQTGGNVGSAGDISGEFHYCRTRLDKPRIPHPPMDLVLILDLLFSQYPNLNQYRDSNWMSLVKRSERKLWQPYFQVVGDRYQADDLSRVAMDVIAKR